MKTNIQNLSYLAQELFCANVFFTCKVANTAILYSERKQKQKLAKVVRDCSFDCDNVLIAIISELNYLHQLYVYFIHKSTKAFLSLVAATRSTPFI
jgi:hypothetical protein